MVKAGCYIVLTLSTSGMGVHGTVSTTVCKALVSIARVQLRMWHLSCHRQFTRLGTRVAICPTSMGCTEGHFAQFWHAWLPAILHKCLETLHKRGDLDWGEAGNKIDIWKGTARRQGKDKRWRFSVSSHLPDTQEKNEPKSLTCVGQVQNKRQDQECNSKD